MRSFFLGAIVAVRGRFRAECFAQEAQGIPGNLQLPELESWEPAARHLRHQNPMEKPRCSAFIPKKTVVLKY